MSKPFVFTLMPFEKSFDDIYRLGIKTACEDEGAYCERVDEQIFQGSILDRIINQISKADVVIGDMTGRNPNVFFEIGYAKALDKKIIFLTSSSEDIPFDLMHYTHIDYGESIVSLKEKLKPHLFHYLKNLDRSQGEILFGLEFYICGKKLNADEVAQIEISSSYRSVPLSVVNNSGKTFEPHSLQLAGSSDDKLQTMFYEHDNKKYIHDVNDKKNMLFSMKTQYFQGHQILFGYAMFHLNQEVPG